MLPMKLFRFRARKRLVFCCCMFSLPKLQFNVKWLRYKLCFTYYYIPIYLEGFIHDLSYNITTLILLSTSGVYNYTRKCMWKIIVSLYWLQSLYRIFTVIYMETVAYLSREQCLRALWARPIWGGGPSTINHYINWENIYFIHQTKDRQGHF